MASSSKAASSSSHTLNLPLESNPPQHKVGIFSALAILGRVFSYIIPIFMVTVSADVIPIPDAFKQWLREPLGLTLCILILFFTSMYQMIVDLTKPKTIREHLDFPERSDAGTVTSKRKQKKRSRKKNRRASSGVRSDEKFNQGVDASEDGHKIGKFFVSNREIDMGSNGILLEGTYDGRRVAVKRLVKACHDVAFKEHLNLSVSDGHPNIVRLYGIESDRDFWYLALERCTCSLNDLIQRSTVSEDQATEVKVRLKGTFPEVKLWTDKGYPSTILVKLMRDVVSGLVHLHKLGMVHRDLKPQNVLILKEGSLCAKLSDLGISKRLVGDKSSLSDHATGCGSSGWQAPEQLLNERQKRAVDMFSLGCVLCYCMTAGGHPFGDRLERDNNIVKGKVDLFLVEHIPEAVDLLSRLLDTDAELRPKASEVLNHPLFWDSDTRLWFLHDVSDRLRLEERKANSDILKALESVSSLAFGSKWNRKMESAFLNHIKKYRRYKYDSVRDLVRVVRNQLNHYLELPLEIQKILGPVNEGFDGYFRSRYPNLLMEVYKVMHQYCREEKGFNKYFKGSVV
ncbi:serine/threonine-protein kinase/endoribonuclease IRE1a-like isoform X2 [Rhododendron vialii]|uniref:serine/threonine-protein kinase/endoribonuclease IRE1a-like isoform X1 n=1 Tax=Rhododendron vialii TaxID=182163 RepID=UPI00265E502B|nr:serine/threonine-protein kinase/endoribonuclease IRE1a-like isoform X1 [Rhododendron vialii]XP_058187194.1 serine/threonine-protein kinase/endoribonuclease IRE1a-like isoform X2 [Rhododendron vialii]